MSDRRRQPRTIGSPCRSHSARRDLARDGRAGDGLLGLKFRDAVGFLPSALLAIKSEVGPAGRTVIPRVVGRRHIGQTAREPVIAAQELVPDAPTAVDSEGG